MWCWLDSDDAIGSFSLPDSICLCVNIMVRHKCAYIPTLKLKKATSSSSGYHGKTPWSDFIIIIVFCILCMQTHVLFCRPSIIFSDSISEKFSNSLVHWHEYYQYFLKWFHQSVGFRLKLSLTILPLVSQMWKWKPANPEGLRSNQMIFLLSQQLRKRSSSAIPNQKATKLQGPSHHSLPVHFLPIFLTPSQSLWLLLVNQLQALHLDTRLIYLISEISVSSVIKHPATPSHRFYSQLHCLLLSW